MSLRVDLVDCCGGLHEKGCTDSYIKMLAHQAVELLEKIKRCGIVGGGVPLGMGFEVS